MLVVYFFKIGDCMKTISRILSNLDGMIKNEDIVVDFQDGRIKRIEEVDKDILIQEVEIKNNKLVLKIWRIDKDANGVEFGGTFRY